MPAAHNIQHWAWESFGYAFDRWWEGLPAGDPLHDADYYPDQLDAFFAAHPDGWPPHPDTPKDLHEYVNERVED